MVLRHEGAFRLAGNASWRCGVRQSSSDSMTSVVAGGLPHDVGREAAVDVARLADALGGTVAAPGISALAGPEPVSSGSAHWSRWIDARRLVGLAGCRTEADLERLCGRRDAVLLDKSSPCVVLDDLGRGSGSERMRSCVEH